MADENGFDYFVQAVALATGAYTIYKEVLQRAKIKIAPGDRMAIVRGPGGVRRIHIRCALSNPTNKIGTRQRLEAKITAPDRTVQRYLWNELFEFVPGSMNVHSAGAPLPISVADKSSQPLLAQLELTDPNIPANCMAGRHEVQILGWVNCRTRYWRANARSVFHINISVAQASTLPTVNLHTSSRTFQLCGW